MNHGIIASLLGFILLGFCSLQCYCLPFSYQRANVVEIIFLFALLGVFMSVEFMDEPTWMITICIFVPFVIIFSILCKIGYSVIHIYSKSEYEVNYNQKYKQMERIKSRAPSSYKQWLQDVINEMKNQNNTYNQIQLAKMKHVRTQTNDIDDFDVNDSDENERDVPTFNGKKTDKADFSESESSSSSSSIEDSEKW